MSRTADRVRRLFRGLRGGKGRFGDEGDVVPSEVASSSGMTSSGLRVGIATHTGPRERNEDYVSASWEGDFLAVSDGIGGARFGDVMSRLACNAAVRAFEEGMHAREAFETANETVSLTSGLLGEQSGATLLVMERIGDVLDLVSAGDTRAFCLRGGRLIALTEDGRASSTSNALSKAVGYGSIEPDVARHTLMGGDRVLLCTDGVWEYLPTRRIVQLLQDGENAPLAAEAIAWEAARAGHDNATCACVFVDELWEPEADTPLMPGGADPYGADTPDALLTP